VFVIDEIVISDEVLERKFVCNLQKCKGACCWEGDFGAPVREAEVPIMEKHIGEILPRLSESSRAKIESEGVARYDLLYEGLVTPLHEDGACVYLFKGEYGVAMCAWEQVYKEEKTPFYKPLSCHLYPLRINKNEETGWEAINYDEWDICKAACSLGEALQIPVFRFVKDALIRAYGADFYDQLEALYEHQTS